MTSTPTPAHRPTGLVPSGGLAGELRAVARPLAPLFAKADPIFLALGARLGGAVDVVGGITATFATLAEEMAGADLVQATASLRAVAGRAGAMAGDLAGEQAALLRMIGLNAEVGLRIGQLRKTVGAISVLAMNAQIAAAGLDVHRDDFTVFTREMTRLAKAAEETIDGYARDQAQLAKLLTAARDSQALFDSRHRATLGTVIRDLEGSLSAVDGRRRAAVGAAEEIGARSGRISQAIGEIVMALQIGDITRQRVEHVGEALEEQADRLDTAAAAGGEAGATCRLQAAQLAHALEEFRAEGDRIGSALGKLADDVQAIVRLGGGLHGAGRGSGADTSFLHDLEMRLAATHGLFTEYGTARRAVDQGVAAATATLDALMQRVGTLHSVEVDIRLVGLNMALKCGKLGNRGAALNAIAQELRAYANRTIEDAGLLMAALREMAAAAAQLKAGDGSPAGAEPGELEQGIDGPLLVFRDRGARLDAAYGALTRDGDAVRRSLDEAAGLLASTAAIGRSMAEARQALDALARADGGGTAPTLSGQGSRRYTMESERLVHSRVGGAGGPAPAAQPAAEETLDDILF
jgi:hypothetical protein